MLKVKPTSYSVYIKHLAGKKKIVDGYTFVAGDAGKLPRQITGVRSLAQRIGRPMLQMSEKFSLRIAPGRSQSAGKDQIEVGVSSKDGKFFHNLCGRMLWPMI